MWPNKYPHCASANLDMPLSEVQIVLGSALFSKYLLPAFFGLLLIGARTLFRFGMLGHITFAVPSIIPNEASNLIAVVTISHWLSLLAFSENLWSILTQTQGNWPYESQTANQFINWTKRFCSMSRSNLLHEGFSNLTVDLDNSTDNLIHCVTAGHLKEFYKIESIAKVAWNRWYLLQNKRLCLRPSKPIYWQRALGLQ